MNIQKTALKIFFPAMYLCGGFAIFAIWAEPFIDEGFYRLLPTFFIIGFASFLTWVVSIVIEFRNIAQTKK